MDLVQWIYESGGDLESSLAPQGSERLGIASSGTNPPRVLKRGTGLSSPHLPFPLVLGVESRNTDETAAAPPSVHVRFVLSGGDGQSEDPISADDEPHLVLARMAEFTSVLCELLAEAELPISNVIPEPRELALEVVLAPLERRTAVDLMRSLLLVRAAAEICADARGFALARTGVVTGDGTERPVTGKLNRYFLEITQ